MRQAQGVEHANLNATINANDEHTWEHNTHCVPTVIPNNKIIAVPVTGSPDSQSFLPVVDSESDGLPAATGIAILRAASQPPR